MAGPQDDEEIVELDMPRPRSISRKPDQRVPHPASTEQEHDLNETSSRNDRRQSDAQKMQRDSIVASDIALANIARDIQQQADIQTPSNDTSIETEHREHASESQTRDDEDRNTAPDAEFQNRMRAVRPSDVEEFQNLIRSDADSSIQRASAPSSKVSQSSASDRESHKRPFEDVEPPADRQQVDEVLAMFSDIEQNPTFDQQYMVHRGSRGITPPPGFDYSAIPPYQDSSDAPSYQNVISQPPGLPLAPPPLTQRPNDTLPESERPRMTDKFMDAHIARHGASSLSPLALLTPDQADTLPEYVQSGLTYDNGHAARGRSREESSMYYTSDDYEGRKATDALDAVRALEEREAVEAIEAMEALRLSGAGSFDAQQLAAIQAMGDDPSNYFSTEELSQFQRLASDPTDDEADNLDDGRDEDQELLQMMAQYVRRSPPELEANMTSSEADAREELEELENMLHDRSLTVNARSSGRPADPISAQSFTALQKAQPDSALVTGPDILAILQQASQVKPEMNTATSAGHFADPNSRTGVDVNALPEAAAARSLEARPDESFEPLPSTAQQQTGFGGGHGVKKTTMDPSAYADQVARNTKRAEAYLALSIQVNDLRRTGERSQAAFDLTTKLLMANPEYYSIWNYRREIMLEGLFPTMDESAKQKLLEEELKRLQGILKDYPKVYWIWNHRKWCLAQCPWPDWSRELLLVTKMLEQDARNFHVWEYRRYVVAQSEKADEASKALREFEYTTAAINSNFSNFSAWHNRTKLIPQILEQIEDGNERDTRRQELLRDELELVKGAIYTDPDDQSVWLYHRWLVNPDSAHRSLHPLAPRTNTEHIKQLTQELEMISELLEEEPDNVWCTYAKVHYGLSRNRLTEDHSNMDELRGLISALERNDKLRSGRYNDWHASTLIDASREVASKSSSTPLVDSMDPALILFSDLKRRTEWSNITLTDASFLTATRASAAGKKSCIVLPSWESVKDFDKSGMPDDVVLVVGEVNGTEAINYYQVEKLE